MYYQLTGEYHDCVGCGFFEQILEAADAASVAAFIEAHALVEGSTWGDCHTFYAEQFTQVDAPTGPVTSLAEMLRDDPMLAEEFRLLQAA